MNKKTLTELLKELPSEQDVAKWQSAKEERHKILERFFDWDKETRLALTNGADCEWEEGLQVKRVTGYTLPELDAMPADDWDKLRTAILKMERKDKPSKKSRQQPEHPITKWVRRYRSKYRSNAEAVREYIAIHGGNYAKLSQDLKNDLKKKPLSTPKKTS